MPNIVYVGTSLDGFIADRDGDLGFLECVPNPDGGDLGFADFMDSIDALLMGCKTFETVLSFGIEWPYAKDVFVYSSSLDEVPAGLAGKAEIVTGDLSDVVSHLHERGFHRLYVDGGELVRTLLERDAVDEMIVARLPIVLGGGTPLFGATERHLHFDHVRTEVLLDQIVKSKYIRRRMQRP